MEEFGFKRGSTFQKQSWVFGDALEILNDSGVDLVHIDDIMIPAFQRSRQWTHDSFTQHTEDAHARYNDVIVQVKLDGFEELV